MTVDNDNLKISSRTNQIPADFQSFQDKAEATTTDNYIKVNRIFYTWYTYDDTILLTISPSPSIAKCSVFCKLNNNTNQVSLHVLSTVYILPQKPPFDWSHFPNGFLPARAGREPMGIGGYTAPFQTSVSKQCRQFKTLTQMKKNCHWTSGHPLLDSWKNENTRTQTFAVCSF